MATWHMVVGLVCFAVTPSPGCKSKDEGDAEQGTTSVDVKPLGFRLGERHKVELSVLGYQVAGEQRRDWRMRGIFDLRLGSPPTGRAFVAQEHQQKWTGTFPPAVFADVMLAHAAPRILLDEQYVAIGFDDIAGLVKTIQEQVTSAGDRMPDGPGVMRLALNAPAINASVHRFWNFAQLAHARAWSADLPASEKIKIQDPLLGPGSIITIRATRSARTCPGGGACTQVQLTLLPDKVTLQEARDKLVGLAAPAAQVSEYHVEDRIRLLARDDDKRTLELHTERRGTITTTDSRGESLKINDYEQRDYRFD